MTSESGRAQAGIYDLGYRSYDGARLGRGYALRSLYVYSLRGAFGLGRSWVAKLFSMGLALLAMIPSFILLGVAAITPEEVDLQLNYFDFVGFGYVGTILALFSAVTAPELIGADERHRTLALDFSRSLSRTDYVAAKLAALLSAVFLVIMLLQIFLLIGNGVATEEVVDYMGDNAGEVLWILASSALIGVTVASITLAIACQTSRRAWATGAVIIYFVISASLGALLLETVSGDDAGYLILVSPIAVLQGAVYWIFDDPLPFTADVAKANLEVGYYLAACAAYTLVGIAVVFRRYWRMTI